MPRPLFTPEELEELRRFDEEVEEDFVMTPEEREVARKREEDIGIQRAYGKDKYMRKYRRINRDRIQIQRQGYRDANREKLNEKAREYRAKNRELVNRRQRGYRADRLLEHRARDRAYYRANPEKMYEKNRKRYWANPEKFRKDAKEYAAAMKLKTSRGMRTYLREYRLRSGLTQKALGAIFGVEAWDISKWECGTAEIKLEIIEAALPELAQELRERDERRKEM